ncbi:MAG: hypothetical protein CL930_14510 [Deltaproteobacteria bacterium]|nr:hypothetical protein [Deltaproteobacteria bacterium]
MSSLFMLLFACTFGPPTPQRCAAMSEGESRDNCWAEVAVDLFRSQGADAIELIESGVSDQRVQDYIWLTVTREVDPRSDRYCKRISTASIAERCRVFVRRPHLHRAMDPPPNSSGGPPPPGSLPGDAAKGIE